MRTYRNASPRAVALVEMGYSEIDMYVDVIEARAERKARDRAAQKARNAKLGIRTFTWEG